LPRPWPAWCDVATSGQPLRVAISRWRLQSRGRIEVVSDVDDDYHVLSIALRRTRKELFVDEKPIWHGAAKDEMLVTGPKRGTWRTTIQGGCDFLRVFLPQTLIAECYAEAFGHAPSDAISVSEINSVVDARLRYLGQAFKGLDGYDPLVGPCVADSLALAFASRLIELAYGVKEDRADEKLIGPRIKRTLEYIEDNIARALSLSELSEIAGLTRIQFARQFKEATGQPPGRRKSRIVEMIEAGCSGSLAHCHSAE
jgi:hypothetical protein